MEKEAGERRNWLKRVHLDYFVASSDSLTIYGFFAFVDPETYSFGIVPMELSPLVGLAFMVLGLYLIMKGRGIFE